MINLKEIRTLNNCSQQKLADLLNVSRSTVAMWETHQSEPSIEMLNNISQIFDVSIDRLLGKEEKSSATTTTENDFKVALFGGDGEVTDEMWDEVKQFAEYVKAKYKKG